MAAVIKSAAVSRRLRVPGGSGALGSAGGGVDHGSQPVTFSGIHATAWGRLKLAGTMDALLASSFLGASRFSFLATAVISERFFRSSAWTAMSCIVGDVKPKLKFRESAGLTSTSPRDRVTTSLPDTS